MEMGEDVRRYKDFKDVWGKEMTDFVEGYEYEDSVRTPDYG